VLNGVTAVEITRITDDDIRSGVATRKPAPQSPGSVLQPAPPDALAVAIGGSRPGLDAGVMAATQSPTISAGADPVAVAALPDAGTPVVVGETALSQVAPPPAVASTAAGPSDKPDERARADTTAGIGWWIQLGAFRQRDGALDFQRRLVDEQAWLAPLLAVFTDHGLNKLQAGPYTSRDDARSAAEHVRSALQLVPTIVEKR
jgi:rare lipoprotein A